MNDHRSNAAAAQCECHLWGEYEEVGVSSDIFPTFDTFYDKFEIIRERNTWLVLAKCKHCNQTWYVSIDTKDTDAIYFVRVTDIQIQDILMNGSWPDAIQVAMNNSPWLGDEIGPDICKISGCNRNRVQYSVLCRLHHCENILGHLWSP